MNDWFGRVVVGFVAGETVESSIVKGPESVEVPMLPAAGLGLEGIDVTETLLEVESEDLENVGDKNVVDITGVIIVDGDGRAGVLETVVVSIFVDEALPDVVSTMAISVDNGCVVCEATAADEIDFELVPNGAAVEELVPNDEDDSETVLGRSVDAAYGGSPRRTGGIDELVLFCIVTGVVAVVGD